MSHRHTSAIEQAALADDAGRSPRYDLTDGIIRYEQGDMNEDETVELFQHLVDTGLAWRLQGHYGRAAHALIDAGLVTVATPER